MRAKSWKNITFPYIQKESKSGKENNFILNDVKGQIQTPPKVTFYVPDFDMRLFLLHFKMKILNNRNVPAKTSK